MRLFHIADAAAWRRAHAAGLYAPASLHAQGFVHLSTAEQVAPTLRRFFSGAKELTLLVLEGDSLGPELRWVDVQHDDDGTRDRFPHLHRGLRVEEVRERHEARDAADLMTRLAGLLDPEP